MKATLFVLQWALGLFWLSFGLDAHNVQAQMRIGQPAAPPDGSAALDISGGPYSNGSTYRGILPPKVALSQTTQASPVTGPAAGLLIYNTAKTGDVAPGYYYWDGSKWMRLSTETTGAARVAAAGDPIPAYTYSEAKALTTAPGTVFMLTEPGQEGLFRNTPVVPPNPSIGSPGDTVSANGIRDNNGNILSSGTVMIVGRQRYKRVSDDGTINVMWFGANNSGSGDASQAIQRAINYAKTLYASNGGWYKTSILIPAGSYLVNKTIDVTKVSGISIRGNGNRHQNTTITGNTGGAIFDFTGSNSSGCENLYLAAGVGWPTPSSIGVQFALNADASAGGYNCSVRNCYFQMIDMPTANNGSGSIGILNCRAEEFAVSDCIIVANIGCIFSNTSNLSAAGLAYTASSPYATVATGQGSMGVINFGGQNSIVNLGKARPAMILNGTNTFNFQGYIARQPGTGNGTEEAAILFCGPVTYNATINTTVEVFSQLMRVRSPLLTSRISGVVANQVNVGTAYPAGADRPPVIDLSGGGQIQGSDISVTFGNGAAEIGNRYLFYSSGPEYAQIKNSTIVCPHWTDNTLLANTTLLANVENTSFKVNQPFEKKPLSVNAVVNNASFSTAGWTVGNYRQIVPTGVLTHASIYVVKVTWWQNGVDNIVQSYVIPISGTDFNPNAQPLPVLTPNITTWSNAGRSINVRYKLPTAVGQTTYGFEASINKADMNNGTLSISVLPLL